MARGGGGFSRSGPAASGNFSPGSGSAFSERSAQHAQTQQTAAVNQQGRASSRQQQLSASQQSRQQQSQSSQQSRQQQQQYAQQSRQQQQSHEQQSRQQTYTQTTQSRQQAAQSYQGAYAPASRYQGAYYANRAYYPPPAAVYAPAARAEYIDNNTVSDGEAAALAVGTAAVGYAMGKAGGSAAHTASAASSSATQTGGLPCKPTTTVVKGVTYYQCGSTWYNQAYGSGGVIYMPVPPPPGY